MTELLDQDLLEVRVDQAGLEFQECFLVNSKLQSIMQHFEHCFTHFPHCSVKCLSLIVELETLDLPNFKLSFIS